MAFGREKKCAGYCTVFCVQTKVHNRNVFTTLYRTKSPPETHIQGLRVEGGGGWGLGGDSVQRSDIAHCTLPTCRLREDTVCTFRRDFLLL